MGRRRREAVDVLGPDDDAPSGPSKTQRKREMEELQALGEQLTRLSDTALATIELDERLRDAIAELKRIKSHEARRRHVQYIGKLMRDADADAIRQAMANLLKRPAPSADPAV